MGDILAAKCVYSNYTLGGGGSNYMMGPASWTHWTSYERDLDQNSIDYLLSNVPHFTWRPE